MHIKVTGDRSLFAHLLEGQTLESNTVPFVSWDINGGIPLGHPRNLETLSRICGRTALDDIVIFALDSSTGAPLGDDPIDPSLSCYELQLTEGKMVYLTTNPFSLFSNPEKAFWVPLSTSSVRFAECGENLSISGLNKRRIIKTKPDGWEDTVAITNTNLNNEEINKWTFRISTVDAIDGTDDQKLGVDEVNEAALGSTMYNYAGTSLDASVKRRAGSTNNNADGSSNGSDTWGEEDNVVESDNLAATSSTVNILKETMRGSAKQFPTVMIGVADDSVPLDDNKVFSSYQRCFMLDVAAGAFYSAGDKRPTYVDGHNYRIHHGMLITFMLETERGVLNVIVNGKNVLATNVTRYLAESLYPVVEIYSSGAVVDIM